MSSCSLIAGLLVSVLLVTFEASGEVCPPWFLYDSNITILSAPQQYSHCVCGEPLLFQIECNEDYTSSLLSGNCAFWNNRTGRTVVGQCPYVFENHLLAGHSMKLPRDVLTLNSWLCSHLNRETGTTACGRCTNGTGPSVSSLGSQCTHCSPVNILYYILLHYLPATVIFLFILIVQVNITSTPMVYYILYSNAWAVYLKTPNGFSIYSLVFAGNYYKYILRAFFFLHSICTFDPLYVISPPLCISSRINDIDVQYFEMLKTAYPFLLLLLGYAGIELHARDFKPVVVLWRPIYRNITRLKRSWNPHLSLVQAFATIFFLSYLKLSSLVFVPFIFTDFIDDHGEYVSHSRVTYIDPTVPVGHPKHITLTVVSMVILVFIILPPILLLMTYPTRLFRKLQENFPPRVNLALKIFVSTYQGWYKDGTDGTRDYRFYSWLTPAAFIIIMAIQYGITSIPVFSYGYPMMIWHINIILFFSLTTLIATLKPHKSEIANNVGVCIAALLGIGSTMYVFSVRYLPTVTTVTYLVAVFTSIPDFVFVGYIIYRMGSKFGLKTLLRKCCLVVQPREMEEHAILNHD